jgi:hypothetical protein
MPFWIQVGNPVSLRMPGKTVSDLSEAIETVFPMVTEDAILVWNRSYIPISYKYDLSVMIDDLLPLLTALLEKRSGRHQVFFGSDTFSTEWHLVWTEESLSISAQWQSVVGHLEAITSDCGSLEIPTGDFLSEWKEMLKRIITALETSSLSMDDMEGYESMIKIESAIRRTGILYQAV